MSNPSPSPRLPSWEQLLGRLYFHERAIPPTKQEFAILRYLAESRETIRPVLGRIALMLSRLEPIKAVVVTQRSATDLQILATTISRKRATAVVGQDFIARLLRARALTERAIGRKDQWLYERYHTVYSCPIGNRSDCCQLLFFTTEPLSQSRIVFLRFAVQILGLRLTKQGLEDQLKREAESVASLTHHLSEGMAVINAERIVTLWNRPLQRVTGYAPTEAIGQPIESTFRHTDNPEWLTGEIDRLTREPLENLFRDEFEIRTKQGHKKWVNVSGSALRDKHQRISQVVIIVRDITEHKLLEQRKNEFISIATHELRTPITAIKGYLSLLEKDKTSLTEKHRSYLQRVTAANDRLVRLAEELLLSVQVEEDRLRLNLRPVNLAVILGKVTRDLRQKAQHKGLELIYTSPDFLTWVVGDEDKVQQVFENLIDNAIKYTTAGAITVWLEKREISGQPVIITYIRDTGIGISSKNYGAIFEKFRRTHNTVQIRESGAGLGLFIVKSFVEKLGGKITVSSRIGRGTTFSVRLNASEEMEDGKKVKEK